MATDPSAKPSFSRARKWGIGFNVVAAVIGVFAVTVMVNYLSGRYFKRFYASSHYRLELSPRTIGLLNSLTNQVEVTLYYQKDDPLYRTLVDLLKEYRGHSANIKVRFVDYVRDAGAAQELKTKHNLGSATNLVIFACEGKPARIVTDAELTEKEIFQVASEKPDTLAFDRRTTAFLGEHKFTAALLGAINPKPLNAYYLQGDGEHPVNQGNLGYASFLTILHEQNYLEIAPLLLEGTNTVPPDCNLLIIAGPADPMSKSGLESIEHYLNEGGRLLALFNFMATNREIGLEKLLARWGVNVSPSVVIDRDLTSPEAPGSDVIVIHFSKHPAVNPLTGRKLQFILPRMISKAELPAQASDNLKASEIAFSGPHSYLTNAPAQPEQSLPLMVAVERGAPRGASPNEHGSTRILVAGDSLFLSHSRIGSGANADFASFAANWLLEREVLLQGVGSQPVKEYRYLMTSNQMHTVQWILLGAIPGGILLFGGLVWFSRRK